MNTLARLRCVGLDDVVWLGKFENRDISRRTFSGGNFRISFYSCCRRVLAKARGKAKPVATSPNLEDMKLPELKELAKQMGLRGTSTMRKPELIATLQAARSGGEAPAGVTVRAPKSAAPAAPVAPAEAQTADAESRRTRLRNPASPTRLPKAKPTRLSSPKSRRPKPLGRPLPDVLIALSVRSAPNRRNVPSAPSVLTVASRLRLRRARRRPMSWPR